MSNDDAVRQRPDGGQLELAITFFYYNDLPKAILFYEEVMGFTLAIDQGWSKICRMEGQAHVGLVDESRGMHRAHDVKPVRLCIRVPDVDVWHAYLSALDIESLGDVFTSEKLGIRAFVFDDPEGYQIRCNRL